jgi:TonB family protein
MDWSAMVLSYLASVTVRSLGMMVLALAGIGVLRVKTAAARHAVWTVVVAGMLLLALLSPSMPPLPLRVLQAAAPVDAIAIPDAPASDLSRAVQSEHVAAAPPIKPFTWQDAAMWLYLGGAAILLLRLAMGYMLTARLLRASRAVPNFRAFKTYEADWTSVPLTVGWLRPRILLPRDWRNWDRTKLEAVLIHEQSHVRRADWAIALLAGVNRCLLWFNPAAWWLERQLAALAEQACDDAAVLQIGERENYAQALLDMAAAVKHGEGRLVWEAMAMAKASEVRMRIERILDETRQIPSGVTKLRWAALVVCSLPLIYVAAAVQLAPALAQEQPPVQTAPAQRPDFAEMERYVAAHPDDLEARGTLIRDYFLYSIKQPRLNHIYWMIQRHPESDLTGMNSVGISPRTSALNDAQDYQTAVSLWKTQVSLHAGDAHVLSNAARFFAQPGSDWNEAERLLTAARSLDKNNSAYTQQLARLYFTAILTAAGDPVFSAGASDPAFAAKAKSELETSTDAQLLALVGGQLSAVGRTQGPFGATAVDLNAHPALASILEMGTRLTTRAQSFGVSRLLSPPAPSEAMLADMRAKADSMATYPLVEAPPAVRKVMPVFPPAATAARIQGIVNMMVVIGTDGRVKDAMVQSGHPFFGQAAVDAIRQWVFTPVLVNGIPTTVRAHVVVPFNMDGSDTPPPPPAPMQQMSATGEPKPALPQRIRVGGLVQQAKLKFSVPPGYPQAARDAGIEGTVELSITISKDGTMQNTSVVDGHPLLAAAAQQAVMQWVYSPTLLNGSPVEVVTTVSVPFKLQ